MTFIGPPKFEFMNRVLHAIVAFTLLIFTGSCGNDGVSAKLVGGGCDGCDLMFIGIPGSISSVSTSPGYKEPGSRLLVKGYVYNADGTSSVPGVIIYYWQTDNTGLYSPKPGMDKRAERHGHIRGWVKSGEDGRYAIYTIRPAPYPNDIIPAHIHLSIKEPGISNPYYVDDLVFADDDLVTAEYRAAMHNRGGNGVMPITFNSDLQVAQHDLFLGLNIPNYPQRP